MAGSIGAVGLLPLDEGADAVARELVVHLSRRLSLPCRLLTQPSATCPPLLDGRRQIDADRLLLELDARRLDLAQADHVVIGITAQDMGSPLFTHFFGRATLGGRTALVSLARLAPTFYGLAADERRTRVRAEVEILHELGHLLGLEHCREIACVMRFAPTVESIDLRGSRFCLSCAERLPRGIVVRSA